MAIHVTHRNMKYFMTFLCLHGIYLMSIFNISRNGILEYFNHISNFFELRTITDMKNNKNDKKKQQFFSLNNTDKQMNMFIIKLKYRMAYEILRFICITNRIYFKTMQCYEVLKLRCYIIYK